MTPIDPEIIAARNRLSMLEEKAKLQERASIAAAMMLSALPHPPGLQTLSPEVEELSPQASPNKAPVLLYAKSGSKLVLVASGGGGGNSSSSSSSDAESRKPA